MSRALTKSEFGRIKTELRQPGSSIDATARKFKRAWDTINKVAKSETLEEYLKGNPHVPKETAAAEPAIVRSLRKQQTEINAHFDDLIDHLLELTK